MAEGRPRKEVRDRVVDLRRVRAGDLKEHRLNWREHPDRQRRALRALLGEIGHADALLAREEDGALILIDGHLRRSLDPEQVVPVLVLDVSEEEADKLLVTLDPLAGLAGSDQGKLSELLERVSTSSAAVQGLLDSVARGARLPALRGLVPPDDAPATPRSATARRGDLWILGPHRLLCGDATAEQDVQRLLDGERPAVTVTDPPYGVSYDPAWRDRAAKEGRLAYAPRRIQEVANDDQADWRDAWVLCPSRALRRSVTPCMEAARAQRGPVSLSSARWGGRSQRAGGRS